MRGGGCACGCGALVVVVWASLRRDEQAKSKHVKGCLVAQLHQASPHRKRARIRTKKRARRRAACGSGRANAREREAGGMGCCVWQAPSRRKSCRVRGATIRAENNSGRHSTARRTTSEPGGLHSAQGRVRPAARAHALGRARGSAWRCGCAAICILSCGSSDYVRRPRVPACPRPCALPAKHNAAQPPMHTYLSLHKARPTSARCADPPLPAAASRAALSCQGCQVRPHFAVPIHPAARRAQLRCRRPARPRSRS